MLIVFNPTAGRRRPGLLWKVIDVLSMHGMRLEIVETRFPGHAESLARDAVRAGTRTVIAAGGDGTIAEVATGLVGSDVMLGIIPLGTANVLAHELGRTPWRRAWRRAERGRIGRGLRMERRIHGCSCK